MSVTSEAHSATRRGSDCYITGAGLVPDIALSYDAEPPEPKKDLLCMKSSNALHLGSSYHEFVVQIDSGFLTVYANTGDRVQPVRGIIKERAFLRDAVVERVTDIQHDVKTTTLVLVSKHPPEAGQPPTEQHWKKLKFRTSSDPKHTDAAITREWETAIQRHIWFYNHNGVIITPDPGIVFELTREQSLVNMEAHKHKNVFVNLCSHELMPHKLKHGAVKEKHVRMICGPERTLRGRTGVYNVVDVVVEEEAVELCMEDVDVKAEVSWLVARELRRRDRSIMKVAQGNSIQYRNKTSYAGLNKDGLACGMLVNDDNVKIFLLDNDEISVNAHEIPLDDDAEQTQQDAFRALAEFTMGGDSTPSGVGASPFQRCTPYLIVRSAGCTIHKTPDAEGKKLGHVKRGDIVYIVGRSAIGGTSDEDMQDCWVLLLYGGWIQLFTHSGVRCLHPALDTTHTISPLDVEVCSTNLMLKVGLSFWDSIFNPTKKKELAVNFTIRLTYSMQGIDGATHQCEVLVQRSLEEFFLLDAEVKKHHAKAMQRASALGAFHPDTALVALPATSDMTEDLLLSEDGAEIMADTVDLVQRWMKQTVTLAGTSVVSFMAPSKADWHVIEASIRPILPSVVIV